MRRSLLALFVVLAPFLAGAQPAPPAAPAVGRGDGPPLRQATGVLGALDAAAGTFQVTRGEEQLSFRTDERSRVFINGELGALAGLKADERVRVDYVAEGEPPFLARQVLDTATSVQRRAEATGFAATLTAIEQRGEGDERQTVAVVTNEQGKRYELVIAPDGRWASVIMKEGVAAALDAYAVGDSVMVALRRSGGAGMYLARLADAPTFRAFFAMRSIRGTVAEVPAEGNQLKLTVEAGAEPVTVTTSRTTVFFAAEARAEANPFKVGDEVVVAFREREQGNVAARAIFAPASWRAYSAFVEAEAARAAAQAAGGGGER